jgi:hypothetical protein
MAWSGQAAPAVEGRLERRVSPQGVHARFLQAWRQELGAEDLGGHESAAPAENQGVGRQRLAGAARARCRGRAFGGPAATRLLRGARRRAFFGREVHEAPVCQGLNLLPELRQAGGEERGIAMLPASASPRLGWARRGFGCFAPCVDDSGAHD